jgi:hypothetical protein
MINIGKYKNIIDDDILIDLYCNQNKSIQEIQEIINCSAKKISKRLKQLNIQIRNLNSPEYYQNRTKVKLPCEICGEKSSTEYSGTGRFYCKRHYSQLKRYGFIMERTKFDMNEIHIKDTYAIVDLYNIKNIKHGEALIDIDDVDLIKSYKWKLDKQGYVYTWVYDEDGKKHRLTMHRLIMKSKKDELTDHINLVKSDNRKFNLRAANKSQNEMNKLIGSNNTSGIKGVWYKKRDNKWVAEIMLNGKKIHLGVFSDINEAKIKREEAEIKYFKEFKCIY